MKKILSIGIVALLLVNLISVTALADASADPGIYNVTVANAFQSTVSYEAQDANGNAVTARAADLDGVPAAEFFANAVKLKVTISNVSDGGFYLILAQSDDSVPKESNIAYIDQATAAGGKVSFTVYPKSLSSGSTYYVYLSSSTSGREELLRFNYYQSYTLGDVNGENGIDLDDAIMIMRYLVDLEDLDETQKMAADVNHQNGVDLDDAVIIMRFLVGLEEIN